MVCISALQRLRGNPDTVLQEMEEMKEEATHSESTVTIREFLTKRRYRQPIRLVLIINLGSQLSGFNAVSSSSSMLEKRTENTECLLSLLDFSSRLNTMSGSDLNYSFFHKKWVGNDFRLVVVPKLVLEVFPIMHEDENILEVA